MLHISYKTHVSERYEMFSTSAIIFKVNMGTFGHRDSSVGIATRYGLDGPGIESGCVLRFSPIAQTVPGAYLMSCTMGIESILRVK